MQINSLPRRRQSSHNISKKTRAWRWLLTQQDDNAGQYGDQRPGAEAGRQDVRLHVAGEDGVFAVAGAHSDGQRVGAAHRRVAVVVDLDGEEENVLRQAAESLPEDVDTGCAVCRGEQKKHIDDYCSQPIHNELDYGHAREPARCASVTSVKYIHHVISSNSCDCDHNGQLASPRFPVRLRFPGKQFLVVITEAPVQTRKKRCDT